MEKQDSKQHHHLTIGQARSITTAKYPLTISQLYKLEEED